MVGSLCDQGENAAYYRVTYRRFIHSNSIWPLSTFAFYMSRFYMQHEGRGKAAKVDENVANWTKICRSTVVLVD